MNDVLLRLVSVWETLTKNTELSAFVSDYDRSYVRERVQAEGLTFLTVTLPQLGKALDAVLRDEGNGVSLPPGWGVVKEGAYPRFLEAAWRVVLSHVTVTKELYTPDPKDPEYVLSRIKDRLLIRRTTPLTLFEQADYAGAVACIRQLTLMYYKLNVPYTDVQVAKVKASFKETETEIARLDWSSIRREILPSGKGLSMDIVLTRARHLVHRLLHRFDPMEIRPRHGSGASACKVQPWERYARPRFIPKLDRVYKYSDWFFLNYNHLLSEMEGLFMLTEEPRPSARVVYVPKDSRGPRLISAEPREFMYIQQGLMAKLYEAIETYPIIKQQLSCIDQTRNQLLAKLGSVYDHVATLDLKEASDRVSVELVEAIFPSNWVESFHACRSEVTTFPDGESVEMRKFAPMGSAVCFPVEAICFWAITLATSLRPWDSMSKRLFALEPRSADASLLEYAVFGDDIICPRDHVDNVVAALHHVGLKVNMDKSYLSGPFRESCGKDYLLGNLVTPVRARFLPESGGSRSVMHKTRFRTADWFNNLIVRFGCQLTQPLRDLFESWYGPVVVLPERTWRLSDEKQRSLKGLSLFGWELSIPTGVKRRMNPKLHRFEVYVPIELSVDKQIDSDDWCHLLRTLLVGSGEKGASLVTLAKRSKYKYGWTPV
jgi:hypothetical protein